MPITAITDPNGMSVLQRLRSLANVGGLSSNGLDLAKADAGGYTDLMPTDSDLQDQQIADADKQEARTGYSYTAPLDEVRNDAMAKLRARLLSGRIQSEADVAKAQAGPAATAAGEVQKARIQAAADAPLKAAQAAHEQMGTKVQESIINPPEDKVWQPGLGYTQGGDASVGGAGNGGGSARPPMKTSIDAKGNPSFSQVMPPAQLQTRMATAQAVGSHIETVRRQAEYLMNKGYLGPVKGRFYNTMTAMNMPSVAASSPQDAAILAAYKANLSTLATGMAMTHGGQRGGGSPIMTARFDQALQNGWTDPAGLLGALGSMHEWLKGYANGSNEDLSSPDTYTPGMLPAGQ